MQAFLEGRLPFLGIVDIVAQIVPEHSASAYALTVEDVLVADRGARMRAGELIAGSLRHASWPKPAQYAGEKGMSHLRLGFRLLIESAAKTHPSRGW